MIKKQKYSILIIVIISCITMSIVEIFIKPIYIVKSMIKIPLFLILPFIYSYFNKNTNLKNLLIPNKKGFKIAFFIGITVYIIIISAYFILNKFFDFGAIIPTLDNTLKIDKKNFIFVALYISFINSLLEEFFFRGFSFFTLKDVSSRKFAYIFSVLMFSLYHISMMIGWFDIILIVLAQIGLFVGGLIFNYCNEKSKNIYISWLIHIFANFAINTVGFILFGII